MPETGSSTAPIAIIAGSLLLTGGLALLLARRGLPS
jgi:LPXTG-motif cell wall-anchored protein